MKPLKHLCLLVLAALLAPAAAAADLSGHGLRGIRAVAVTVEGVHPALARYGFTERELAATVRARLAASGVEVVPPEEALRRPDAAVLEVKVHINRHTNDYPDRLPYALDVRLKQRLALPSAEDAFVAATVWSNGRSGLAQPIRLTRLNGYAASLIDEFVAALRAQNRG